MKATIHNCTCRGRGTKRQQHGKWHSAINCTPGSPRHASWSHQSSEGRLLWLYSILTSCKHECIAMGVGSQGAFLCSRQDAQCCTCRCCTLRPEFSCMKTSCPQVRSAAYASATQIAAYHHTSAAQAHAAAVRRPCFSDVASCRHALCGNADECDKFIELATPRLKDAAHGPDRAVFKRGEVPIIRGASQGAQGSPRPCLLLGS